MNLKWKAQLLVISVATLTSGLSAWSSFRSTRAMIENGKHRELRTVAMLLQDEIATESAEAAARASMIANLPAIQRLFRDRNRKELTDRLQPAFLVARDQFDVSDAQFHLAPATSFLRIFTPDEGHDEDLSSFREMVLATNRHQEPQRGVEVGRHGLSVRGVYPVQDAEGAIGSFEVGMDFRLILEDVKKITGHEVGVFVDHELMTRVATMLPKVDAERVIGGYQNVEATDWQALRPLVSPDLLKGVIDVRTDLQTVNGVDYGIVLVPLPDHKGKNIGLVVSCRSFAEFQTQANWALTHSVAMAALQLILLIGALQVALGGLVLRPVMAIAAALGQVADDTGAPDLPGLAKRDDEIGKMAQQLVRLEAAKQLAGKQASDARSTDGPSRG